MHTQSADATGLLIEGSPTAVATYNIINGLVCEPGGTGGHSIKNTDDTTAGNIIILTDNTYLGMSLTPNFLKQNTVIAGSNSWLPQLATTHLKADTIEYTGTATATAVAAGTATALPAAPEGYMQVLIYGQPALIPYYPHV
jgi:hypothetical protein